jgi:molybdopterin-guanine dinucleotide biosynthesis protein A
VVLAAVVLAGGQARRLGGADKPLIEIGGRTLACSVISAAAAAGADPVVLVGPDRPGLMTELTRFGLVDRVELTSEQPAGRGPVPGLRAGVELLTDIDWVLLLAADLPFLTGALLGEMVAAAAGAGADGGVGAVAVDGAGRAQWLTSCWRVAALRTALARYEGDSLRGLLAPLGASLVTMTSEPGKSGLQGEAGHQGRPPFWLDCDTPEDVAAARNWIAPEGSARA